MRTLLMYFYPDRLPVFRATDDGRINFRKEIIKSQGDEKYLMGYFNSLGKTFDEKFSNVKKHVDSKTTNPIFWSDPIIKMNYIEDDDFDDIEIEKLHSDNNS